MATYNEYEDKEALIENPSIPDINKVKADDMNYIKYNLPHISNEVDEDYRVNLVHSNNLFDLSYRTFDAQLLSTTNVSLFNGVFTATISSGYAHTGYVIPVEVGKQYTIKWTNATGINSVQCNGSYPGSSSDLYFRSYNTSDTITITATSNTLFIKLLASGATMTITNLMINIGSSALTYEPYITPSIVVDNDEIYNQNIMNYSTNEQVIGKWIDGKPLYRKCFEKSSLVVGDNTITTGLTIDNLVRLDCNLYRNNGIWHSLTFANSSNLNATMSITYQAGTISINVGSAITNASKCYIILEYTKTID